MRQVFIGDVAEHAAEDRDPDPACEEHVPLIRVFGEQEASLRFFHLCLGPDRKLDQRALEGGVAQARAEAEPPTLVRRGDDGEVAARSALVVVGRIEQGDEEVLTGRELDLFAQQIEGDEQRPLRDFTLLGDARAQPTSRRP